MKHHSRYKDKYKMSVFFSNNNIVAPSPLFLDIKLTNSVEKKLFLKDETLSAW